MLKQKRGRTGKIKLKWLPQYHNVSDVPLNTNASQLCKRYTFVKIQ